MRRLRGNARDHSCIYHQWCYDTKGDLIGVPMMRGMRGMGGYPEDFRKEDHGLRKLRVASFSGVVFGTFSEETPPLEDYLGPAVRERLRLVVGKPLRVTGYHRHTVRSNWKLFVENTRDMYHAPMLHPFLPVFGILQPGQRGEMTLWHRGGLNSCFSVYADNPPPGAAGPPPGKATAALGKDGPPVPASRLTLEDPSVAVSQPEFPDGLDISIISIFPSCLFTLPGNTFSVRQIRPKSPGVVDTLYTWYAFAEDDEQMLDIRRRQNNLFGSAGYVAMEDAEALELIQARISDGALAGESFVEFGGRGVEDRIDHMLSEGALRGFWKGYCDIMDIPLERAA